MDKLFILLLVFQLIRETSACSNCFYISWYFWFGLFWVGFAIVILIGYCCRKYKQRNQINAVTVGRAPPPKPTQAQGPPPYTAQSAQPPAYTQYGPPQPMMSGGSDPAYPPGMYPPPPPPANYNDPAYPPR